LAGLGSPTVIVLYPPPQGTEQPPTRLESQHGPSKPQDFVPQQHQILSPAVAAVTRTTRMRILAIGHNGQYKDKNQHTAVTTPPPGQSHVKSHLVHECIAFQANTGRIQLQGETNKTPMYLWFVPKK